MTKQEITFLKFVAVCTAAYYLYHKAKSQGGSMAGQINAAKIAGLGASLLPVEYRSKAKRIGTQFISQLIQ